jgi:hypothetical protein
MLWVLGPSNDASITLISFLYFEKKCFEKVLPRALPCCGYWAQAVRQLYIILYFNHIYLQKHVPKSRRRADGDPTSSTAMLWVLGPSNDASRRRPSSPRRASTMTGPWVSEDRSAWVENRWSKKRVRFMSKGFSVGEWVQYLGVMEVR